jgi:formylglycine-generating enzyme required for sulfatase activity/serine/threonine protein kinase
MSSPTPPAERAGSVPLVLAAGARPLPDYELKALLGRGGFGEVWRATGPGGFDVALKFVRLEGQAGDVERRALETIKGLRHAHLLPVFGAWERDGWLIMAMELADKTLMDRLHEYRKAGKTGISHNELLGCLRDAARALDHLAEARPGADGKTTFLQHRDVKPQNLMLVGGTVKVADFGLVKVLEHTSTQASSRMTPAYTAPEVIQNRLTRWSDQYSLAASYCVLRGGRMPFAGDAMQQMYGHLQKEPDLSMLPEPERPVVARALAKEPNQRWPSCAAFVEALAQAVRRLPPADSADPSPLLPPAEAPESWRLPLSSHDTAPGPLPPTLPSMPRPGRRGSRMAVALVGLLLVGLAVAVWVGVRGRRGNPADPADRPVTQVDPNREKEDRENKDREEKEARDRVEKEAKEKKGREDKKTPPEPQPAPKLRLTVPPELMLTAGDSQALRVLVVRTNCPGPVTLRIEGATAGLTAKDGRIDAGQDEGRLLLSAGVVAAPGLRSVRVVAEAEGVTESALVGVIVTKKPEAAKEVTLDLGGGVKLKMVRIPAKGKSFWMGSPVGEKIRSEDEEQHEVEFSSDYWLGVTEVTQAQWLAVLGGKNPSYFCKDGEGAKEVKDMNTDGFPVENVTWEEAKEFCRNLTKKLDDGHEYRLPREAEWEYACRGGAAEKDSFPFYLKGGPTRSLSGGQINFDGNVPYGNDNGSKGKNLGRTAEVGSYPEAVNAFGLYDMHGNVWEWCEDWYGEYPKGKTIDPRGPEGGLNRVIRGGSWNGYGQYCRAAIRFWRAPSYRSSSLGFRLARVPVR